MLRAQLRAQMSYRTSFVIEVIGSTFATSLDLLTVLVIFGVTKTLGGFPFPDAFLMATMAGVAFALCDLIVSNIDDLQAMVRSGKLDTLLVRPMGLLGQLLAAEFELRRFGRIAQSLTAFGIAIAVASIHATPARVALLIVTPLFGAIFFGSIFVMASTVAFWWIDSGQFANGFTYGGRDFATYPITVYGLVFRRLFAFGLGFAFVAYYPALAILGRPDPLGLPGWVGWTSPLVAACFAGIAAFVWRFGVRHYRSTGS
jgi:ABC-2 type transport system permease protein